MSFDTEKLSQINARIRSIRKAAEELQAMGDELPALYRNCARILASTKMLELDFSDVVDLKP